MFGASELVLLSFFDAQSAALRFLDALTALKCVQCQEKGIFDRIDKQLTSCNITVTEKES